ncbi:Rv0909 family putative TA system antitoxin [Gulosibacter sp. 10]|uniref:Rv0909 family putative TA system antitoxin n=1 Tax=Gulosibacter sp. 10 TaxID=1255570 RepID=UPI00097F3F85|nr:Rv0909 family putative TA system antitoxin [Gulosibacter sp. 10]SJM60358.1 hypothetical protein FM112_07110 [Gulosibacter sp. 10]
MVDFGSIGDKFNEAKKNIDPEQAGAFIDKASGAAKNATGNRFDSQIDGVAAKAAEFFGDEGDKRPEQR